MSRKEVNASMTSRESLEGAFLYMGILDAYEAVGAELIGPNVLEEHVIPRMVYYVREFLPEIFSAGSLEDILQVDFGYDQMIVADPGGEVTVPKDIRRILLLIGPEGGFADFEKNLLVNQGARLLSLGPTRLRSETAAIVAVSKILTAYGQI